MLPRILKPLKGRVRKRKIAVFDIEGDGSENGFVCGSVMIGGKIYSFLDRDRMARFLLSRRTRNHYIFAVNLQYDLPILYQPFSPEWQFQFSNSRLIRAVYDDGNKHKWTFLDTLNVAPGFSVEKMGKVIGLPKLQMPEALVSSTSTGRLHQRITPDVLKKIVEYNQRDVEIPYRFLTMWQDGLLELGTQLKPTVASTAVDLFRRQYLRRAYIQPEKYVNEWIRQGYYGGRVEVFKKGYVEDVYYYDFNSLYPSVMLEYEYPDVGSQRSVHCPRNINEVLEQKGIVEAEVQIDDMYIPPIPFRYEQRLIFPTGVIKGVWTTDELRALREYGGRVKRIKKGWIYTCTVRPFVDYVTDLYEKRQEYKKKGDDRQYVVKIMLNSLYGKFGQRLEQPGGEMRVLRPDDDPNELVGCDEVEWGGYIWVQKKRKNKRIPCFINTVWACYITAYARLKLWEKMNEVGDDVVYCDTDSIVTHKKLSTSSKLGDLKLEHHIQEGIFLYPKVYYIKTDEDEEMYKVRGVPRSYRKEFFMKGSVVYRQPTKIKGAIRRGKRMAVWEEVKKENKVTFDKRIVLNNNVDFMHDFSDTRPYSF